MVVGQPRPLKTPRDPQAEALLHLVGLEVMLQVGNHSVHWVPVEEKEAVVIADGVEALQEGVLWQAVAAVALH